MAVNESNMTASRGLQRWHAEVVLSGGSKRYHDPARWTDPYSSNPLDITLYVSCYNEAAYIVETLDKVCAAAREVGLTYELIVIDDGSKDNSTELVCDYIAKHPDENIALRVNAINKGLAQNYFDGAFLGKGKYYRLICGDHSETRESLVKILGSVGQADIIVPYYTSSEGKGASREGISTAYTTLVNLLSGNRLHYYNGLSVHLRHNVMRWHSPTRGFGFQAELICTLIDLGFTYREVSMSVVERRTGRSNAITFRNLVSVAHTILEIFGRRVSKLIYHWK